jgi:hypothetical protein
VGFSVPRACMILFSQGVGRGIMHGAWCSSIHSAVLHRIFIAGWWGEVVVLFSVWQSVGRLSTG